MSSVVLDTPGRVQDMVLASRQGAVVGAVYEPAKQATLA